MDALEQYLKIEKVDPTQITDSSVQHKEQKYNEMDHGVTEVEQKGKKFITDAKQVGYGKEGMLDLCSGGGNQGWEWLYGKEVCVVNSSLIPHNTERE